MGELHDFFKSLEKGKKGEAIVAKYLAALPHVVALDYKGKDEAFQKMDIDFPIRNRDGHEWSVEVKTDYKDHPENLFYETISCIRTGSIGCMDKTRAQYIAYYFIEPNIIYWFQVKPFRAWFHANMGNPRIRRIHPKNKGYTSEGYLVPLDLLKEESPRWMQVVSLKGENENDKRV